MAVVLLGGVAFGDERVGRRSFVEPFHTTDAVILDQFVVALPGYFESRQGQRFSLAFGLERRLTEAMSLSVASEWIANNPDAGPDETGGGNIDLFLKHTVKIDRRHEFLLSAGLGATIATGQRSVGAGGDDILRPTAMFAKGLGDLPDGLWRLHPIAIMGDAGLETAVSTNAPGDVFFYDVALLYSLPYLETYVWDPRLPPIIRDLTPLVELNFRTTVNGAQRQTTGFIAPGIALTRRWYQIGVGSRFPLNDTTRKDLNWGVLAMIDVFYSSLAPELYGTPWFQ